MNRTRIVESRIEPLVSTQRLDEYCANRFTYLSREQWRKEIAAGTVSLNGLVAPDAAVMISGGELLAWNGGSIAEPEIDDGITILYEDDWFVAVDKTGNLPVHPGGRYFNNTLVRLWKSGAAARSIRCTASTAKHRGLSFRPLPAEPREGCPLRLPRAQKNIWRWCTVAFPRKK